MNIVNIGKLDAFMQQYAQALHKAVTEHNAEYGYPVEHVPAVVAKMKAAIVLGSYSHDGRGFKGACKALGIKHTRKAIEEYIERTPEAKLCEAGEVKDDN